MTERKEENPESPTAPLLEARNITKTFPGVKALDHVNLEVHSGEVHAVVGENGAGKSTLMNILSGSISPDSGEIIVKGKPCRFRSPRDGENSGISIIHQELSLVPFMSVAENIFLGRAPTTLYGTISWKTLYAQASELLEELNLSVDLRGTAASNPIGVQQMIEIAKALSLDASMIIMDEPTSSLSESEAERLFEIIEQLRKAGKGIVYITHRMEEVYRIAQRITVLRDGKNVGTARTEDLQRDQMISWMVGREVESFYTRHPGKPGSVVLEVDGLTLPAPEGINPKVDGVSLELHAGEILGIAGLMGAGNSELLGAIFGRYGRRARGGIRINGRPANLRHPLEAIKKGLCLLTNDRKASGLVMPLSVARNMTLASLSEVSKFGWLKEARERTLAKHYQDTLDIRVPSLDSEVYTLSGGNQQKVILAKWMMTNPSVILLDEPTRGIDVGAKAEIYRLMDAWTARGKAILLITSELPELLAMSDRILVMRRGRVSAEFSREEADPRKVMAAAV